VWYVLVSEVAIGWGIDVLCVGSRILCRCLTIACRCLEVKILESVLLYMEKYELRNMFHELENKLLKPAYQTTRK
jgi:hypothetical protein